MTSAPLTREQEGGVLFSLSTVDTQYMFIFSRILIQILWVVVNSFPSVLKTPIAYWMKDKQLPNFGNTILEL